MTPAHSSQSVVDAEGGKATFTPISGEYDRMNRIMSLGLHSAWRRRALALAHVKGFEPERILDIASGTGDFAIAAAERFPSARITGIDITTAMTDIAATKTAAYPAGGRISFMECDACDLSRFADGSFSLALCAFGFRNFPDKEKALKEAARVLSTGGRLVVLELFRPGSRIMGSLVSAWIAVTGCFFAHTYKMEYAYLRASVRKTLSPGAFTALAEAAGFRLLRKASFFPGATALVLVK